MNTNKLSYLPINFLFSIITFAVAFVLLTTNGVSDHNSTIIAAVIYIYDVFSNAKSDYYDSEIEKLKKQIK